MMKHAKDMHGFTLIETLVAISILTLTMAAPFYAIEQSITAADVSRDELTGSNLAQEGVEYVRAVRDGNYLFTRAFPASTQSWMYGLDGTTSGGGQSPNCFAPNVCTVDLNPAASPAAVSYTSVASILPLNINSNFLYTQQSGGTPTGFTRSVQLSCSTGGTCVPSTAQEVKVVVTVTWKTRNIPYVTTITEYLDNWLP